MDEIDTDNFEIFYFASGWVDRILQMTLTPANRHLHNLNDFIR